MGPPCMGIASGFNNMSFCSLLLGGPGSVWRTALALQGFGVSTSGIRVR